MMKTMAQPDILRLPLLGRFLLWKHSRTAIQILLFMLAAAMLLDGLLGNQLAAKNMATVGAWVHYRGLVVVALLVAGNLFCAGCPFLLPRKLARWIGRPARRWPKALRNKWLALAALLGILFVYELYDLWASPWLTAWVIVAYFVLAFVLEAVFTRDSFCMYVCPLGTFNFLYSTVSPLQIGSRDLQVCRDCEGHECINGHYTAGGDLIQQGCQLELYVPTINSNLDCTLCLDCAKACPYDNVALHTRMPGDELFRQQWPRRLDLALLAILLTFAGLMNAFAMTPPVYALEQGLANALGVQQEWIILGLLFLVVVGIVPLVLVYASAWLNRRFLPARATGSLSRQVIRFAYSFVPLGIGIWGAHYLFHLLIGPLTIVPATQNFFVAVFGTPLLGAPDWQVGGQWVPPLRVVQAVQMLLMAGGTVGALAVAWHTGRQTFGRRALWVGTLPWCLLLLVVGLVAVLVFLQPMEMRGNVLG